MAKKRTKNIIKHTTKNPNLAFLILIFVLTMIPITLWAIQNFRGLDSKAAGNSNPYYLSCEVGYKRGTGLTCDFANHHLQTLNPGETKSITIDLSTCNGRVSNWDIVMKKWSCKNGELTTKYGDLSTVSTTITKVSPTTGIETPVVCGESNPWCTYGRKLTMFYWTLTGNPVIFKVTSTNNDTRPVNIYTYWSGGIGSP